MNHFSEVLNQGKRKEGEVIQQPTHEPVKANGEQKAKAEWTDEQRKRRDSLFEMIDAACHTVVSSPQTMSEFLVVQGRFEKYSLNNNILIYAQKPNATKIKDFNGWKNEGGTVKKGSKGFMILEPMPYIKNGEQRTTFKVKTVFDVSDVADAPPTPPVSFDSAMLIRALVHDCPVNIKTVQNYPADKLDGACFDVEDKCIYAKAGMSVNDIFTSVSQAIACAEFARNTNGPFRVSDHEFQARCVAYALAQKYGVSSDKVNLYSMPARYASYDSEQIKKELSEIHGAIKAITGRMNEVLFERPGGKNQNRNAREAR